MIESNQETNSNAFTKYNKLISDYKSLREKYNILKPALVAEREKTKSIEKSVIDGEMKNRKLNQEIESLKFRNELLTKQVSALRDELDNERIKKSKKPIFTKNPSKNCDESLNVIKEELMNKITECSNLHIKLSTLKSDHQSENNNFRSAINDLENQLRLIREQSDITDSNMKKSLDKEIEERRLLENKLERKEDIILKLKNNEQTLLNEIKLFKNSQCVTPDSIANDDKLQKADNEKSSEDSKSYDDSNSNIVYNSKEAYICSLIDKIALLEKSFNSLELNYEILQKRYHHEKQNKEFYESYITNNGLELPKLQIQSKNQARQIEKPNEMLEKFYQDKIQKLTRQLYQMTAKTAVYFDELKVFENRFDMQTMEKSLLNSENENLKKRLYSLEEDLDLTRNQYETKLKETSIYIAQLCSQLEASYSNNKQKTQSNHEEQSKGFLSNFRR